MTETSTSSTSDHDLDLVYTDPDIDSVSEEVEFAITSSDTLHYDPDSGSIAAIL